MLLFRKSFYTRSDLQMTLMYVPLRWEIGLEMHGDVAQLIRAEQTEYEKEMFAKKGVLTCDSCGNALLFFVGAVPGSVKLSAPQLNISSILWKCEPHVSKI